MKIKWFKIHKQPKMGTNESNLHQMQRVWNAKEQEQSSSPHQILATETALIGCL